MRNRAKCRLCGEIIESFAVGDYITCKCGEIGVHGGPIKFECAVRSDWGNFVRIDDNDKEVEIKVMEKAAIKANLTTENPINEWAEKEIDKAKPPCKADLHDELERMIANIEGLPQEVLMQPVSHYDLAAALMLISAILRSD